MKTKLILTAAALWLAIVAAPAANAQVNPTPWPATWNCSQSNIPCLRINNTYASGGNTTALELYSIGSRTLFTRSDTDGALLAIVGSVGNPNSTGVLSVGGRFINYGQGYSATFSGARGLQSSGTSGPGATLTSTLSDAVVGITDSVGKSGGWFANNAAGGPGLSAAGDGYLWGGTWYTTSSRLLKKDIVVMDDGLSRVLALEPKWFSWREDGPRGKQRHPGFLAEDVQKVSSELVAVAKHTSSLALAVAPESAVEVEMLAVDYQGMTALAISAIKKQYEIIVALEKRVAALELLAQQAPSTPKE